MPTGLDRSILVSQVKYRLRWYLRTRRQLPGEIGLWAAPQVRLVIKRPETGTFVFRARKRFGAQDNLLVYEPAETAVFLARVKRSSIFFDIGAHIGYYSLIAASHKNIRRVVAMEIFPNLAAEVRFHAKMNGFEHIRVETAALGDGKSVIDFNNRTFRKGGQTISLDDYVGERGLQPDLIKIDIEGFEYLALQGATKTLMKSPDLMLSVHPRFIAEKGASTEALLEQLRAWYAHIYLIESGFRVGEGNPVETLEILPSSRIPEQGFVIWCSEDSLV